MPRFIHLADLHLGRIFHGESLLEDQAHMLNQISEICAADPPDAIILAGDLFDRALPPVEAMGLLDDFFSAAAEAGIQVVAIPGNHDSPGRLAYASRAWKQLGIHLRADYTKLVCPVTIQGRDGGEFDIFAFPFVEPGVLRGSFSDSPDSPEFLTGGKTELIAAAMDKIRAAFTPGRPKVLVAHEFVAGSKESGSERLYVGGTQSVPSELYQGFDYVALGHIHGAQSAGDQFIRYSGSPMAYAFDEAGNDKGYLEVTLDSSRLYPEVIFHPLKPSRPLEILQDSLDNLLNLKKYQAARESYVSVRVTDSLSHLNLIGRLRERFPYLRELRQMALESPDTAGLPASGQTAAAETPDTVLSDFLGRAGWDDEDERGMAMDFLKEAMEKPEAAE